MNSRQRTPRLEYDRVSSSLGVSTLAALNATDTRRTRAPSRSLVGTTDCGANSPRIIYIS